MRPVLRGNSPQVDDFEPYDTAKPFLIGRLGMYCSYCERRLVTCVHVEHIQAKSLSTYRHLIGHWENFLLACGNCNPCKHDKEVIFENVLLPDRDNTFAALQYLEDGTISPSALAISGGVETQAQALLDLVGLNKTSGEVQDENGKLLALDRMAQRMEVWEAGLEIKRAIAAEPNNHAHHKAVLIAAKGYGHFSIWLTIFADYPEICHLLIDAFPGTRASGCFDLTTSQIISPSPNRDGLAVGGRI